MAIENGADAVETNVANPKKESQILNNIDKVTNSSVPAYVMEKNPNEFKSAEQNNFMNSPAWAEYSANIFRAFDTDRYPGFAAIEEVSNDPLWKANVDAYGDFVAKRAQAISGFYKKANNRFSRFRRAYSSQSYGLEVAAARKDLSNAVRDGDEAAIAEAKLKLSVLQKKQYQEGMPYDNWEFGDTLASIAASAGRNPEVIPIAAGGVVLSGVTGGASTVAANAINSLLIGADTYKVESGSDLMQLDKLYPDMSEEEKFEKVRWGAIGKAMIEGGVFGLGGSALSLGAKSIGGAIGKKAVKTAAEKLAGTEITKEANKTLLKTAFIKALQNPAEEKTFKELAKRLGKDLVFSGIGEGTQEVFQDSITNAMLNSVKNGTKMSDELLEDWTDFMQRPFAPEHAQKWSTFINVALASPILGAGYSAVGAGIEYADIKKSRDGLGNAADKLKGALNNNLGLSQLFAIQGEADAKNGTPVSNAVLQAQIKRGEISGKLYTTVEQVKKMQEDPEVAEALEAMGVAEGLENASENGGVVELDFAAYDEIVNQKQNTTLFQKMRNYLSFSETTMTIEEYNQFIRDSGKQVAGALSEEIRNDKNSVFNQAKEMFIKAGMEEGEAEGNAAIIHTVLANAKGFTQDQKNDILDRVRITIEGKNGDSIIQKFNNAMAASEVAPDGSRIVNMGDNKQTAISFNKIAKGKNKGKYTVGITDNTGLSSVMKDTGGWSTAEEKAKAAVFETEAEAQAAVQTMYAKTEGNGVDLDVGAAFNEVFTETPDGETKVYHMFVGEGADLSVLPQGFQDRIQKAKAMMAEGKSEEEVFNETHLHIAPDGKLRVQISDVDAQLTEDSNKILSWDSLGNLHGKSCKLEDIFEHEVLFDLYPNLRKLPIYFRGSRTYMSGFGYMNIGSTQSKSRIRQSILHELQHAIQDKENWAQGGSYKDYTGRNPDFRARQDLIKKVAPKIIASGIITYWNASEGGNTKSYGYDTINPDEMRALIESPALDKLIQEDAEFAADIEQIKKLNKKLEGFDSALSKIRYYRLFGEAESRMTERLSYMTQEQLDAINPYDYFDVTKFIIKDKYGNIIKENIEAPKNKQKTGEFNVVFDPETGRSIIDGTLREAGRTVARNGKYDIVLTPDANATTFAHEVFHMFSLELQRVYNNGTISDYWKKQAVKMFKLAEAEVVEGAPVVLTEAQEEKLANMFTTYIMKGKIENYEVRGMLAKLIEMFKTVYRQAESRDLTEKALNNKAYEFFNTVVSSMDAIEEIQRNAGLLEIAEPAGVDRELYDYYIANLAVSKVEASEDLRKKLFAIDAFRKSAEYTTLLQKFKDEAIADLTDTTRYKIVANSALYNEATKVEQTTLWAQNEFPELDLSEGDVADILDNTKPLEQAATEQANEEMENYIAQKYQLTREELGFKEERNRAKVRALLAEAVMRRGGTIKDIDLEIKKAEEASDKCLGKTSVYQIINLGKWKDREAAAVERYTWAKNNDRQDLMSAERFNQAVINLIMIKSNGFKSEYQKITALFDKLQDKQKQYQRKDEHGRPYGPAEHRYHADDWELLRSISEKFGNKINDKRRSTKTVHQQMKEWIQTHFDNRFTTVTALEEYIPFVERGHDGAIGSMKGKDFKKLWAVVGTINGIATREQQLFLDGQYAELASFVRQTVDFFRDMKIDTEGRGFLGFTSGEFLGKYGTWTNPEPLAKAIFPPEVFNKIFLPMFQGATLSESVAKQWIDKWQAVKKKVDLSTKEFVLDDGSRITYGVETKKVMTYADVANLLLAMGAEHSYENYKLKFNLTDEQAYQIASQAIKRNKSYVEFMNTTWSVYGEATEKLNASFKERNNELFVEKEHRAFDIDGIHFDGGYVPEDKHYQALVRELGSWNQGSNIHKKKAWKNEQVLTKAADGDILSIVDITETKLSQSAKWIYAATPYNNIKKFLENKEISDLIGDRIFNFFKDWLQNWDTPHFDESGMWRPLSRMTTLSALGMRASTALLQLSGLVQAAQVLKPVYLARGMLQFIREDGFFKPFKIQEKKSVYMASRVANPFANKLGMDIEGATFKEMFDKYNAKSALGKIGAGILTAYQRVGMSMIQLVDGWVATITWNGAYARALDKGLSDEEARLEADSVVRITQSDAMQISRSAAMQEPWARAVTAFGTWTMGMRSQTQAFTTSKKYAKEYVAWTLSWVVVASLIEAYLKDLIEPADKGDEDKETLERVTHSWYNKIAEAVGTQIIPFAGLGSAATKTVLGALEPEDDEKIFKVFAGGNVSALQYAYRMAESAGKLIDYMQTGEEEQRDKFFIAASGLVSNNIKKHIKKALED